MELAQIKKEREELELELARAIDLIDDLREVIKQKDKIINSLNAQTGKFLSELQQQGVR